MVPRIFLKKLCGKPRMHEEMGNGERSPIPHFPFTIYPFTYFNNLKRITYNV